MAPFDFTGKVALVTGSSRGIGAGIVSALGKSGARCIVNYVPDPEDRNRADAEAVAAELPNARVLACDVGSEESVRRMMEQIGIEFGGLDLLVNNAGILRDRTIAKMSAEEWNSVLQVNLTGAFHCLQAALPLLREDGRIVNISSVSAWMGFYGQANYAASKAGLAALTRVAAHELARRRITVNAVAPGFIGTEMTHNLPEDVKAHALEQIPCARFGEVADIVNAVLFLCSKDSGYITGQVLHVNGGLHMP